MVRGLLQQLFGHKAPTVNRNKVWNKRISPRLEILEDRFAPATLTVDDDRVQKPNAHYTSIQAALNAASIGDTIKVYNGTYTEALDITKNNVKLLANGNAVKILASAGLANDAIVDVIGAKNVVIDGFIIDGAGNQTGTIDSGIRVRNGGSATIEDNIIKGLFNENIAGGAKVGFGVHIGDDNSGATAKVIDNSISEFFKSGVLVDVGGVNKTSSAIIRDNRITGNGGINGSSPSADLVQNGVDINGTNGRVDVRVTDNNIQDCVGINPEFSAAGVLLETVGTDDWVLIQCNSITDNETGVLAQFSDGSNGCDSGIKIYHNSIIHNTGDGIFLYEANNIDLVGNCVSYNELGGITLFDSSNNDIVGNATSHNSLDGIYIYGGSCNTIKFDVSLSNEVDGIRLENTSSNLILSSVIALNGGSGINLINADNNIIKFNISAYNDGYGIASDVDSTGNVIDCNAVFCNGEGNIVSGLEGFSAELTAVASESEEASELEEGVEAPPEE